MSARFERVYKTLSNDLPIVLAIFASVALVISLSLFYEDYMSSLRGYESLPTVKSSLWVIYMAAAVLQVGQVMFAWAYGQEGKRWQFLLFMFLLLADLTTDVIFKAGGSKNPGIWIIAFIESLALFTVGSEVMLITASAMLFNVGPKALDQLGGLVDIALGDKDDGQSSDKPHDMQRRPATVKHGNRPKGGYSG